MSRADEAPSGADDPVAFLEDVFARRGGEEYLGEAVTMAEHMLQSATFARREGESDEIVAAALVHDVGHFGGERGTFSMSDTHDRLHEETGAEALAGVFPPVVIDCIRHHVAAKRYLCAVDPDYFGALSEASVHSLALQGGPMSEEEVVAFERNPHREAIVKVRRYDDRGKVAGMVTPPFAEFVPLLRRVIDRYAGGETIGR